MLTPLPSDPTTVSPQPGVPKHVAIHCDCQLRLAPKLCNHGPPAARTQWIHHLGPTTTWAVTFWLCLSLLPPQVWFPAKKLFPLRLFPPKQFTTLQGRTDQQCMGRWKRHLDPSITREAWTCAEDSILNKQYVVHGSQWSSIARSLPGRTAQQCRAR